MNVSYRCLAVDGSLKSLIIKSFSLYLLTISRCINETIKYSKQTQKNIEIFSVSANKTKQNKKKNNFLIIVRNKNA